MKTSSVNRALLNARTDANTGNWLPVGPTNVSSENRGIGRVNRIAFHPTNVNILYLAGATGGLWITTDGGSNWYSYSEGIPNMSLSGIAVDHSNPSVLYILTGDGDAANSGARGQFLYGKTSTGVLKSFDGGFTWHHTGLRFTEPDNISGYKLIMHPTNPSILLVPTNNGIYRTTDGGNTWTQQQQAADFYDIEFHPTNPSIVYACGKTADSIVVMKSTNAGQSFTQTHAIRRSLNYDGENSANRSALAVSAANSNHVYLLTGPCTSAGMFQGFYRSTDAGENFTLRTNSPNILGGSSLGNDARDQEGYDMAVTVSPTNVNNVVCGGIRLWTSTNGGSTFSFQDDYVSFMSYYHVDIHDLAYHPLNNNRLYMCSDGGVYLSLDNGDNWSSLNNNLQITQYYKIATNPISGLGLENIIMGGTQDNGTNKRGTGGGSSFTQILGADGMDCLIDPDGTGTYIASTQNGVFYLSTNSGSSFEKIGDAEEIGNILNTTVNDRWVTPVGEVTGGTIQFVLGYQPAVLATRIGSGSYAFTKLGWSGLSFVKTARGNSNRIYLGDNRYTNNSNNFIVTTTNLGSTWTTVLNESSGTRVTDLAFDPTNGAKIWITYGGYDAGRKVRFSSDGGANWTFLNGTLPNVPINCIVYDNSPGSAPDALYIGTDIGVFYRDNTMNDWRPFSNNLPVVEITDLEVHPMERLLRAGTYGRGIWQTSLYSSCPSSIDLTASNTAIFKPYYFQASQTVGSTALHGSSGANVFYKAGSHISLTPGFGAWATTDNVFSASIGPCVSGVPQKVQSTTLKQVRGVLVD